MKKTNAIRLLNSSGISYKTLEYQVETDNFSGEHVAKLIGMPAEQVFKTLVTKGDKTGVTIFCIPVNAELNLKRAAAESQNKRIEMLPMKDIFAVTGYIRGGCSPVGMKKTFPTFIDESAVLFNEIAISAGVRGCQIVINAETLCSFISGKFCDVVN